MRRARSSLQEKRRSPRPRLVGVALHLGLGDHPSMHGVWPVGEAQRTHLGPHARERKILADARPAMQLHGLVDHLERDAITLICEMSGAAARTPWVSIAQAVLRQSRRAISMLMRASAMMSGLAPSRASFWPKAERALARRHIASSARSDWPIARMQWWMRPGPSRPCAISKPRPRPRINASLGTRTSVKRMCMWPWGASSAP